LTKLKKDPAQIKGQFVLLSGEPAIQATWYWPGSSLYGVFNMSATGGRVAVQLPDGTYADLLSGASVCVQDGQMAIPGDAAIVRYVEELEPKPLYSHLLDYYRETE
jgi:hypothetical protein